MTNSGGTPAGWYYAPGDAEGTQRYWDGAQWIGEPQVVPQQAAPQAPVVPPAPQTPPPTDATVAYTPPAADPGAGQPPQYGAPPAAGQQPPAAGQPPQYGAAPAGQPPVYGAAPGGQPPAYGSTPPGAGAPPGYVAFGGPGAAGQAGTLAEGWQRIVARLIDNILVVIASFIIGIVVAIAVDNIIGSIFAGLIGVAIAVGYEVLMTTKADATLGKKVFNMRIVNEDGSHVDESVMFKRTLPILVIGLIGVVPLIGWLFSGLLGLAVVIMSLVWIFSDEKRRSVYDKVGNTIVIVEN